MKKINLKGLSEILSEKELKNVMGGSDPFDKNALMYCYDCTGCIKPCFDGFDACLDQFANDCPYGGSFWACG